MSISQTHRNREEWWLLGARGWGNKENWKMEQTFRYKMNKIWGPNINAVTIVDHTAV